MTQDSVYISNEINGSALSYSISYYVSTSNILCGSAIIRPSSCVNGTCRHIFDLALSSCIMGTKFILTVMATNVFGDGPVSNYSVSVSQDTDDKINRYISGENVLRTWIASSSLGSLLLLTLVLTLSIVLSIVTVVSIRSKKRMQSEIQQIHGDADPVEAKVIYEEVELTPQPVPPTVIYTEENIAYANTSGYK